ncbi:hypothetical protein GCM10022216_00740 [Sphingobacterium kyonggiense]|uniref:DoxX-like protein n=1 Tax=Sphingobacterium kyonggiense TaxID=714075 RepID=A0ABP7Y645_9SPHI
MENTIKNQEISKVVNVLKYLFVIVPIVAGADKFTNLLCNWEQYLNPTMADILPFSGAVFMKIVGVIEIVAGLIVLKKPIIGGYIVSAWLALIAISLLTSLNYLDVAVRDLVMAISALSMAKLSNILK